MSKLDNYIKMIKEFYYQKNGKELSIAFLEYMITLLEKIKEEDWHE